MEVGVRRTHTTEIDWLVWSDEFVADRGDSAGRFGRCDRGPDRDVARSLGARDVDCGEHGCAGGNSVVDDDHQASVQVDRRVGGPERLRSAFEFSCFAFCDGYEGSFIEVDGSQNRLIDDSNSTLADRARREFRMPRNPEFAHDENVQISLENPGDFVGDRDAAARKSEYHRVIPAKVLE